MIYQLSDYPFADRNIFSLQEERFKEHFYQCYGKFVHQTLFLKGAKNQYFLYVWIEDFQNGKSIFDDPIKELVIRDYLDCFDYKRMESNEIFLELYDFKRALVSYAYGHTFEAIQQVLQKDTNWNDNRFLLDYSTDSFIIIVLNAAIYKIWENKTEELKRLIFQVLQQYDDYGVIKITDVRLKIQLSNTKNEKDLNDVLMTNRKI